MTVISVPNTATNVIPGRARALFNVRYNDAQTRASIEERIAACCQAAAKEMGADYELKFSHTGDVFLTEPGPLVETMSAAVRAVTGREAKLTTTGGTSDARFIKDHCPVVELGLLNATIHQVDERVPLADLETLTQDLRALHRRLFCQDVIADVIARRAWPWPTGGARDERCASRGACRRTRSPGRAR